MLYKNFIRPLLFKLDAEQAHDYTHRLGSELSDNQAMLSIIGSVFSHQSDDLKQNFLGLTFDSPVGLAAGFDKNGHLMPLMQSLGFGFVEVGSITAHASNGNPRPRLVRLPDDHALINRMGLNNDGAAEITKRVSKTKSRIRIPVGINIAKTHNPRILGDLAVQDYITSFEYAQSVADYITVNISCPNTEEGKTFEDPAALKELIQALNKVRSGTCPVFMKLSADLSLSELDVLLDLCENGRIDGYVLTNTSSLRSSLGHSSLIASQHFGRGGLSGEPLYLNMIKLVNHTYVQTGSLKPIIAVGGINSPQKALNALKNGASLVQIYTGLIYEGPFLVSTFNKYLTKYMRDHKITSIQELRR